MLNFNELETADLIPYIQSALDGSGLTDWERKFCGDILDGKYGWNERGYLTEGQDRKARQVLDRLHNKPEPEKTVELATVHSFLKGAKKHLKYPKIGLQLPDGSPVTLYISGDRSKYPDTLNVKISDIDRYSEDWYGRIFDDGVWHRPRNVNPEKVAQLVVLLKDLADDPAGVAMAYGKITGNCCFCRRPLSDDRSTEVGFGPVCADHYGLKEFWKKGDGDGAHAEASVSTYTPINRRRIRARHTSVT